jgi:hypothetical protein
MKIDRALFLFLTGSIAGVACNASAPPREPSNAAPTSDASAGSSPSSMTASPSSSAVSASPAAIPTPPSSPIADAGSPPIATGSDAGAPAATSASASTLPPVDPSTLKPVGPDHGCGKGKRAFDESRTGCDDMAGAAPDCGTLQMGYASSEVCPGPVYVRRRCYLANANFKPLVAQAAHACLGKTTGKYCNSCNIYQCGYNALMGACPDPTADATCDTIARSCSGIDRARCRAYLSGMSPKGRANMTTCLKNKCEKGFLSCMETLPEK